MQDSGPIKDMMMEWHKVFALRTLGGPASGAAVWALVIKDELVRHETARETFDSGHGTAEDLERFHGSGLVIVVAIAQVLAFEKRVRKLTGKAELREARERFHQVVPRAIAIRDIAAYLDAYAVGEGDRQTGRGRKHEPLIQQEHVEPLRHWEPETGQSSLQLGGEKINLHAAAQASLELAEVVEHVRAKELKAAQDRAAKAAERALHKVVSPDSPAEGRAEGTDALTRPHNTPERG